MEIAPKLTEEIRSGLSLSHSIIEKQGEFINVGEKFKIQFICQNVSQMTNIVFNNPRIFVKGTNFATPAGGDKWYNFPDKKIQNLERTYCIVEFIARRAQGDPVLLEEIAEVSVWADLDLQTFFSFGNTTIVKANIIVNT